MSLDADIIEVPDYIGRNIHKYRNDFLDWIYDPNNPHPYRIELKNSSGNVYYAMCYDTTTFVDWLNTYVIRHPDIPAMILERGLDIESRPAGMLRIWF
jgi:hypothetical protein